MKGQIPAVVAAATLGALLAAAASADDKKETDKKDRDESAQKSCVDLTRIRNTTVIDDHTILFSLRNGDILLNYLPQACPDLAREKRFTYRVTANRLCDVDTITVLQDFGLGLGPGATCRLGPFNPISEEAAEDLKAGPRKSLITSEQVEPIKTDDSAGGSADAAGREAGTEADEGAAGASEAEGAGAGAANDSAATSAGKSKAESRREKRERRRRAREQD
jgi:hypothetical protein